MSGPRLIVCGGRDFADPVFIWDTLDSLFPVLLIHGDCKTGADACADSWARDRGVDRVLIPASWDGHGRAAGPIRNKLMATLGIADALLAFPGGRGTESMVREARRAGLRIIDKRANHTS